jgi:hypothetical protein
MERRKALAVAATVTGTVAAAGAAMAVNFGLLGAQPSEAGKLDARNVSTLTSDESTTTTEPDIQVIYQDIPVPGAGGGGSTGGSSGGSGNGVVAPAPAAPSGSSTYAPPGDDRYEDDDHDEYEHEDESDDEDGPEVHEGEEDDD